MTFPTTPVIDNANRANENPISNGGLWDTTTHPYGLGNVVVSSNEITSAAVAFASAQTTDNTFGPDAEMYLDVPTVGSSPTYAVLLRWGGGATAEGYEIDCHPGTDYKVYREHAGVETQLGATITTSLLAQGDSWGASIVGSTITIYRKPSGGSWAQVDTRTDSTITGAGHLGFIVSNNANFFDNIGGGTVSSSQTIAIGRVSSPAAVRGADLAPSGSVSISLGKLASSATVRGADVSPAPSTIALGKIASTVAVRGVNTSPSGAVDLTLGRIASPTAVRGVDLAVGASTLALGKVASPSAVRGVGLAASGAVDIALGRISSAAAVRGVTVREVAHIDQLVLTPAAAGGPSLTPAATDQL